MSGPLSVISFSSVAEEARIAARALADFGNDLINPTLRIGVTGLSRAGKTVFITALVHNLVRGGRLPVFEAMARGRIASARLEPQPDDAVPRFDYETHLASLLEQRAWPQSTRRISELRLVITYQPASSTTRENFLTLDLVDYPGEWLLDLPLLGKSYAEWSAETIIRSRESLRAALAAPWHAHLATLRAEKPADEQDARIAAQLFTEYLRACRDERLAMSLLPPGRFLMPGDLEGSPALTFAPLQPPRSGRASSKSIWAMMERRFEAYKDHVVRPFFREHFARLDRQIVLIDALAAFNSGPQAVQELQASLGSILDCFRVGRSSWMSALFRPRIDRILFAATKADHLHHTSHDRLEQILSRMVERAIDRAKFGGALVDVIALSAVRATREATVERGGEKLPSIIGTPEAGEHADGEVFDGKTETAMFPGDLPDSADALFGPNASFKGLSDATGADADYRFLRFRPPALRGSGMVPATLPHIRLDRALQFLLGDRLA
ncbi:MAG: YcjX family protein [Variibacter sp.]